MPQDVKDILSLLLNIPPEQHLKIQATFRKHTGNAVSRTVNLALAGATVSDVLRVFDIWFAIWVAGVTIITLMTFLRSKKSYWNCRIFSGDKGLIRQINLQRIAICSVVLFIPLVGWKGGEGPRRQKVMEGRL